MDKHDITNREYKKFIEANPQWQKEQIPDTLQDGNYLKDWDGINYPKGQGDFPVTYVCPYAAKAYAYWVGKRLPMESEWEFTAKPAGCNSCIFPWDNTDATPGKANYADGANRHKVKVGSFPPNKLGIYDITGNVSQFCLDNWLPDRYAKSAQFMKTRKPFQPLTPAQRKVVAIRGASWNDPVEKLIVTYREECAVIKCSASVRFRCAENARK